MSVTLATSSGSVENRNDSAHQGWIPASRQIAATVASAIFRCRPSSLVVQCVTPYLFGGGFSVAAMTLARSTSRGRPERGPSTSPARPPRKYRPRHAITVGRETPTRCATSAFDIPCPPSSTIHARRARPAGTVDERVQRSSSTRSFSWIIKAGAGRFAIPRHRNYPTVKQLTTRATRLGYRPAAVARRPDRHCRCREPRPRRHGRRTEVAAPPRRGESTRPAPCSPDRPRRELR